MGELHGLALGLDPVRPLLPLALVLRLLGRLVRPDLDDLDAQRLQFILLVVDQARGVKG